MSVRVRLTRVGSRKNPIWRVVVADQRSPRDGRFIEAIGRYNPQTEPSTISIDEERLQHWLARGAQPTGTVKQLIKAQRASGVAAAEPAREPPVEATPGPEAEATPETAVASGTGEGQPESALPGEPAPGADGLIADPELAAAERSSAVEGAPPAEGEAVAEGPASAEGDAAAERAAPPADRDT